MAEAPAVATAEEEGRGRSSEHVTREAIEGALRVFLPLSSTRGLAWFNIHVEQPRVEAGCWGVGHRQRRPIIDGQSDGGGRP